MPKIFERVDNVVYERDFGHNTRRVFQRITDDDNESFMKNAEENLLWEHIRKASRNDPVLQDLLDRCVIHYKLTKKP